MAMELIALLVIMTNASRVTIIKLWWTEFHALLVLVRIFTSRYQKCVLIVYFMLSRISVSSIIGVAECASLYGTDCLTCNRIECLTCDHNKILDDETSETACVGK